MFLYYRQQNDKLARVCLWRHKQTRANLSDYKIQIMNTFTRYSLFEFCNLLQQ